MLRAISAVLAILASLALASAARAADEAGFEPIFDGQSLTGWSGQDMSFWSVEDGAMTGTISPDHAPAMNQYLVYQPALVDDFELKLDFRLTGSATPNTNGGFQFRSRRLPGGDVAGYQVDNNFGQPWKVRLYDEFGRHDLALEGQRCRFDGQGRKHVEPLPLEAGAADFRLDEWHEYHLIADGPNLALAINGRLVAACTDDDPEQFEPAGVLAMQLHTGPPMKAQFKNVRLKRLGRAQSLSPRQQLMAVAALDWRLGHRAASHQPPLAVTGKMAPGLAAQGTGARGDALVARLEGAYFDGGKDWNASGSALTVFVRARVADGNWSHALFAKRGGRDRVNFNLFGVDLPGQPGADIGFEIRTDRGTFQASFPVSRMDAQAWHDLVGRYDGAAIEILCDGKVMDRRDAGGELVKNDEPILIGAQTDDGRVVRPFTGELEEAALWTRALSDDELQVVTRSEPQPPRAVPARLAAGDHTRTLSVDERQRSYLIHVPPGYAPETPTPVVLVFHGLGMNARLMAAFCGMHQKSDEAGFIAVYPNGTGPANLLYLTFNAGGVSAERAKTRPDDVRFVAELLDELAREVNVDARRVYATGISNGGMMCYRLAAELSDRIAAIAPVAASVAIDQTKPSRPVSVMHFHGAADPIVPFGGPSQDTPPFVRFKSVEESIRLWVKLNQCPEEPAVTDLPDAEDDGTRVKRKTFGPGPDGAEVVLFVIEGGGHTWPGQKSPLALLGKSTLDISANDLIWEFFKKHSLK
ncbi:MAG: family 16 glycoside hydrolase [Pirellulales bacterium]